MVEEAAIVVAIDSLASVFGGEIEVEFDEENGLLEIGF
jgi:hypothetical protein